MDVHCSSCGEPWDTYHLRHDAIFETGLSHEEAKAWTGLPQSQRLSKHYRESFKAAGYEFGASVLDVLSCPGCPPSAKPDPDIAMLKAGLVEILGDDEDAIASTLEGTWAMNANEVPHARFGLGQVVATPNALSKLTHEDILAAIQRHQAGDWGEVDSHDRQENELSLEKGFRLLSVYRSSAGVKFWIITEADRSVTTVLMPEDY